MGRRYMAGAVALLCVLLAVTDELGARLAARTQSSVVIGGQQPGMPAPGVPAGPAPPFPMPARDRPAGDNPRGTSTIRGQVVAADTGAPLRRALVRAFGQTGVGNGIAQTDGEDVGLGEYFGAKLADAASVLHGLIERSGELRSEK